MRQVQQQGKDKMHKKYLTTYESYAIMLSITIAVCDLIQEGERNGFCFLSFLPLLQNGVPYNRTTNKPPDGKRGIFQ